MSDPIEFLPPADLLDDPLPAEDAPETGGDCPAAPDDVPGIDGDCPWVVIDDGSFVFVDGPIEDGEDPVSPGDDGIWYWHCGTDDGFVFEDENGGDGTPPSDDVDWDFDPVILYATGGPGGFGKTGRPLPNPHDGPNGDAPGGPKAQVPVADAGHGSDHGTPALIVWFDGFFGA